VRRYTSLAQVERLFRTLKGQELPIRPLQHRTEARVRARRFLGLLAYSVDWHRRQTLAPFFCEEHALPVDRPHRDPVTPAKPSAAATHNKLARRTEEGWPIPSVTTLMADLGTRCRHRGRLDPDPQSPTCVQETQPPPLQARARELIRLLPVPGS